MATVFAPFVMIFSDATQVATLQALYPAGVAGPPATVGPSFGCPLGGTTPPYTLIPLWNNSGAHTADASWTESGSTVSWWGSFVLEGAAGAGPTGSAVADRRWVMGFELPPGGEGLSPLDTSGLASSISRDASRTVEGFGLAFRSAQGIMVIRRLDEYSAVASPASWERVYVRVRQRSTGSVNIWASGGSNSSFHGLYLFINAAGQIEVYNRSLVGGFTLLTTVAAPLAIGTWYRLDLFLSYAVAPSTPGYYELSLNGVLAVSGTVAYDDTGFGGLGKPQNHTTSYLGERLGVANSLEIDFDDWTNRASAASQAGIAAWKTTYAFDWNNGSHCRRIRPRGQAASFANWTGDWRETLENPATQSIGRLTSATGGAKASVTTDATAIVAAGAAQNGAAAYVVGMYGRKGIGGGDGTLGTDTTQTSIGVQATTDEFKSVLFAALATAQDLSGLILAHVRGSIGGTAALGMLAAVVEYLGVFGAEDVPVGDTIPRTFPPVFLHNAPFPDTEWSAPLTAPLAEVSIAGGTYVGNDTGQDITTLDPPHWIWIRPLTGPAGGGRWVAPAPASTRGDTTAALADAVVEAFAVSGAFGFRVSGNDSQVNAAGVTYQYIAFCDPGMRYSCGGACRHTTGLASTINLLADPAFTPDAAFLALIALTSSTSRGIWYRGLGHTAANASPINATSEQASVASTGVGSVTTYAAVHDPAANASTAYLTFRVADGAGSTDVTVQILSYTGDGTGQRTIMLTPTSGRWPMFALVAPHSGHGVVCRDPSHAGTTSANADSFADVADGIVGGGIDQIVVHANLNTLGVIYDVFVIPGCPGNSSWANGTCVVAAPLPPGGPWPPNPNPTPPTPAPPAPPTPPPPAPAQPDVCTSPILGGGT